ncbi:MAG: aminopeptidase [Candidatus Eisenbacteria bacterium]|nr:aminopeptidase [Candidatus Eisenbacteria bacterium]
MQDPRMDKLADLLIGHSTHLKKGEAVLIEATDIPREMVSALIRRAAEAGGTPLLLLKDNQLMRQLVQTGTPDQVEGRMKLIGSVERFQMEKVQAYIGMRGQHNSTEFASVEPAKMKSYQSHVFKHVHGDYRVPNTKWVVLRWPHPAMAQLAGVSTDKFEDYYFDVCLVDYAHMAVAVKPLVEAMEKADQVRILGPGETDLTFSIKGIPVIPCCGEKNVPDGECYSCPVKDSVNGVIHYNAKTIYQGIIFENIRLVFKNGKIVEATGSDTEKLNNILDTDEGSRYLGEFAFGFNPKIKKPMCDILFDEKIGGSIHLAAGSSYEDAFNGNTSSVHWDMVLIQTPDHGGGEVWFDGELIRKNGDFVPKALQGLNPANYGS